MPFGINKKKNKYALAIHYIQLLVEVGLQLLPLPMWVGDAYTSLVAHAFASESIEITFEPKATAAGIAASTTATSTA